MIIQETEGKVLISLKDFTYITKSIGVKFDENTYRNHIKEGKMRNGIIYNGMYGAWIDKGVYTAVFEDQMLCSNCVKLQNTIDNIHLLSK